MALSAGAVYATAGVRVDESGYREFERRQHALREEARRPIHAQAGARVDESGFARFRRALGGARNEAGRPIHGKAGLEVDPSGFRRLRREEDQAEEHSRRFSLGVRSHLGDLRVGIAGAAAAGGYAFGRLGLAAIGTASDINESLTKNQVLFGRYADDVDRFSRRSAAALGISRTAALEYTGVFGNLFTALGETQKHSAGMSVGLTKLAADMASFNNASIDDTLEAIRSGIVGEVEPLRQFGVNLNDAQLRQEAMAQGLTHTTKNVLTPHQRALAAVALITKQTASAHGDFARTQGGLANQTRILRARLSDLGAELGAKLLPVALDAVKWANRMADGFRNGTGAGGRLRHTLENVRDGAKDVGGAIKDTAGWLKEHARLVEVAAAAWLGYKGATKGLDILNRLRGPAGPGGPGGGITGALTARGSSPANPLFVVDVNGGPGGGRGPGGTVPGGRGVPDEPVGRFPRIRGVLRAAGRVGGALAAADVAVNLVDSRGNPIGAVVNTAHDLTFGLTPKIKIPSSDERQNKQIDDLRRRLESAFNAPSVKPLQAARREIKLMAEEADKFGDHDLAKRFRDLESDTRKTGTAFKGSRQELRELNDKVDDARGKLRAAKAPMQDLKKGTDEYRAAAKIAAARQDDLNEALRNVRKAERPAARTFTTIAGSVAGMGQVVADSIDSVGSNVNNVLKDLGAKGLRYTIKHPKKAGHDAGAFAGALGNLRAGGGIPHPGSGGRDDHVLIDPSGQPVALMSGTEGILNTPQMAEVDEALAIKRALGLGRFGSLGDLWGSGMRHYAGGGTIEPVPGFPGERAAARVIPLIEQIAHRFNLVLTDAYGQGHQSPGHTRYGTAADFAGPDRNMDRAVAALVKAGYLVGYDGRFGSQAWPGHGPTRVAGANAHLHVELGGKGGNIGGAVADIARRVIAGPEGPLRTIAQRSSDRVVSAANDYITRQAGAALSAPVAGGGTGGMGKRALAALWRSVNPGLGDPNLMAAIALAESGGRANIVNSIGAGGLWQINPPEPNYLNPVTNARIAGRKLRTQGLRAWEAYTNGSYRQFLARGGRLRRFAGGGSLAGAAPLTGNLGGPPSDEFSNPNPGTRLSIKSLRGVAGDKIGDYNDVLKDIERERRHYEQIDRRYNQSDEVLIDPKTGALNQGAIEKRAGELGNLLKVRKRIVRLFERAERIIKRVRATYATIIHRLERSLRHAKKKDRSGIRAQIKGYKAKRRTWLNTLRDDLRPDMVDARLDVGDIEKEGAELRGTQSEPQDTPGDLGADTADTGATAAEDPNAQAIAAQATARAEAAEADLATLRQNVAVITGSGDLGTGGRNALAAGAFAGAAGTDPLAAGVPGSTGAPRLTAAQTAGLAGTTVNLNVHSFVPPSGAEQQRLAGVVVGALDAQGAIPATRERVP